MNNSGSLLDPPKSSLLDPPKSSESTSVLANHSLQPARRPVGPAENFMRRLANGDLARQNIAARNAWLQSKINAQEQNYRDNSDVSGHPSNPRLSGTSPGNALGLYKQVYKSVPMAPSVSPMGPGPESTPNANPPTSSFAATKEAKKAAAHDAKEAAKAASQATKKAAAQAKKL